MKDYCYILLLIANLTICTQPSAQQVDVVSFANKSYFHDLQQEKFFLHTNKTMYFAGETIWWKAYVVSDFNNKVINNTTNLHVNLYDSYKVLISHQLFYCNDGKAFGEISLPENLKTGRYYINVETQWNKNFEAKLVKFSNFLLFRPMSYNILMSILDNFEPYS